MPIEFGARIADIPAYPIAAGYDLGGDYAMLASNEAPFAPAESVQAAAAKVLGGVNRYPNPAYPDLRRALSEHYGIDPTLISLGNGSCDLLFTAAAALLEPGAEFVFAWPSFSEYPRLAAVTGARAVRVPLDDEERHDLDAMAAEITVATRLVIVCNPNNPTSTALDLEAIDAFLAKVPPQCAVILDEAYIEFSRVVGDTHASVPLLTKYPNLIILRTFSKVYGLAGLRVGYGLGSSPEFVQATHQVRQPFFLNAAAQAAAVEALARQDEVERRVSATIAAREAMVAGLKGLGLWVAASDANFVWVKLSAKAVPATEATPVVERGIVTGLSERGVLVRAGSALGRAGFLRVTVGTEPENTTFLGALEDLLG